LALPAALLALLPLGLLLFGLLSTFLGDFFPRLLALCNLVQESLVILGLALLAIVLIGFLALGEGQSHAVIVLPRRTLITTDHIPLDIFLLLIFSTYASDDFLFFSIARAGCRLGGGFAGLVFLIFRALALALFRSGVGEFEVLVLALGGPTGATRFVWLHR
jgi:hypothetical protein